MTITRLIKKLEQIKSERGDLKLYTNREEYSVINTEKFDSIDNPNYRGQEVIVWKNDNN